MAVINGVTGTIAVTGQIATNPISWTLNYEQSRVESTIYGDTTRKFIPGVMQWSGTYTLRHDDSQVITAPSTAISSMTLTAASGQTYAGAAVTDSCSISHEFDGGPLIVVSFTGNGALTIT